MCEIALSNDSAAFLAYEMFQGYATASKYFRGLGQKVDSMHEDVNVRFDRLDATYGEFGKRMESLDETIKEMKDEFREMRTQFTRLVEHFINKNR